ncbi:MAG: GYD domain-containing protein [Chloroflexi bacterium]|nr:GYD domain-containing protein [Chloroflexota bacterium]
MPVYMMQGAYTPQAWASLAKNPQDRSTVISAELQKLGGKLICFYHCFGEYDTVVIYELPDDASAGAFAISVAAPGFLKAVKTTVLMTPEEAMEAMRKAGAVPYQVSL